MTQGRTVQQHLQWIESLDHLPIIQLPNALEAQLRNIGEEDIPIILSALGHMKHSDGTLSSWGAQSVYGYIVDRYPQFRLELMRQDPKTVMDAMDAISTNESQEYRVHLWNAALAVKGDAEWLMLDLMLDRAMADAIWGYDEQALDEILNNTDLHQYWNGEHPQQYDLYHRLLGQRNPFVGQMFQFNEWVEALVRAGADINRAGRKSNNEPIPCALVCAVMQAKDEVVLPVWEAAFISAMLTYGADWLEAKTLAGDGPVGQFIAQHPVVRRHQLAQIAEHKARDPLKPRNL